MKKKSKSKSKYAVGGPIGTPPVSSPPPMGQRPLRPDEMNAFKNPTPSTPPTPSMYSGKMGLTGRLDPITDRPVMPSQPVMPTPQPRPSNFNIGGLQFGGPNGFDSRPQPAQIEPRLRQQPLGLSALPPAGYKGNRGIPTPESVLARYQAQKMRGKAPQRAIPKPVAGRMPPNPRPNIAQPLPFKKGGKIDGCAMRGMTKGKNK